MSLIGNKFAVISLGSSCQPAQQLKNHSSKISLLLGDELKHSRLPFDWVIGTAARTAAWIRSGVEFPASPRDLDRLSDQATALHWRNKGIFFWHDFKNQDILDVDGTFDHTNAVYRKSFDLFRKLKDLDKVFFVVGNTQNNLPRVLGTHYVGYSFDNKNLKELKTAAESVVGRSCEMLCVTYLDRSDLGAPGLEGVLVSTIQRDETSWTGDDNAWCASFDQFFNDVPLTCF